jgi:hypothetical protein
MSDRDTGTQREQKELWLLLIGVLFVFAGVSSLAVATGLQSKGAPRTKQSLKTVAGELKIIQLDEGELGHKFTVTLNDKTILKTDGDDEASEFAAFPIPEILKRVDQSVPPFDEVVIFQQNMWGNACNGGPIWFLGLKKDGSYDRSEKIDFCGGRAPVIQTAPGKITITFPGGPPNRGTGYVRGETWVYENGRVRQLKPPKR